MSDLMGRTVGVIIADQDSFVALFDDVEEAKDYLHYITRKNKSINYRLEIYEHNSTIKTQLAI